MCRHTMCRHTTICVLILTYLPKVEVELAVICAFLPFRTPHYRAHICLCFIPKHACAHTQPPRAHIHALLKRFIRVWWLVVTFCVCVCVRACVCGSLCVKNTHATRIPAQHIPSRSIGSWRCDGRLLLFCAAGTLSLTCPCSVLLFVTILHFCRIAFELQGDTVGTLTFWPLFFALYKLQSYCLV
jgi:hypothetical protein